jgi:uncharacterized RDD family membrane protein YckC
MIENQKIEDLGEPVNHEEIHTVTLWVRLGIFIIDSFFIGTLLSLIQLVLIQFHIIIPEGFIINKDLTYIIHWQGILFANLATYFYYFIMESTRSQTFGKIITRTIVVNRYDEPPTWKEIALRTLVRFIPLEPLTFIPSGIGLHDRLSQTYVKSIPMPKDQGY